MVDFSEERGQSDLPSLSRRIRALEQRVAQLASAAGTVSRAAVGAGGQLLVEGLLKVRGSVSMLDDSGVELLRIGDMGIGRGLEVKRDDGSSALVVRKAFFNSSNQSVEIYDRSNRKIVAESGLGPGLGSPSLEMPFQPVAAASGTAVTCGPYGWERTTTSTSWETLFTHDGKVQNPFLDLKLAARNSDGVTAGEIRVVDAAGVPLAGFFLPAWVGVITAAMTTMTLIDPDAQWVALPLFGPGQGVGDQMRLGIQVRRTSGSGSLTLSVAQAIGG